MFSYGKIPYTGLSNAETVKQIESGYRLPCPENCPKEVYDIMMSCWNSNPASRPSFEKLGDIFDKMIGLQDDQESVMADFETVQQDSFYVYN